MKRRGDDTKFVANVLAIGTECDIALLAVEDDQFWEGPEPLSLGALPRLQVGDGWGWGGGDGGVGLGGQALGGGDVFPLIIHMYTRSNVMLINWYLEKRKTHLYLHGVHFLVWTGSIT